MSNEDEEPLMTLGASLPRLWLAMACTGGLSFLLFWIAFVGRPSLGYQIAFLAAATGLIFLTDKLRRAGQDKIVLTRNVLKTESGRVLTRLDNVRTVERGIFAFKPPNGFLVTLDAPSGGGWVPGLWWQRGRWIGVGGVVPASRSRAMAEAMTALAMGFKPGEPPENP